MLNAVSFSSRFFQIPLCFHDLSDRWNVAFCQGLKISSNYVIQGCDIQKHSHASELQSSRPLQSSQLLPHRNLHLQWDACNGIRSQNLGQERHRGTACQYKTIENGKTVTIPCQFLVNICQCFRDLWECKSTVRDIWRITWEKSCDHLFEGEGGQTADLSFIFLQFPSSIIPCLHVSTSFFCSFSFILCLSPLQCQDLPQPGWGMLIACIFQFLWNCWHQSSEGYHLLFKVTQQIWHLESLGILDEHGRTYACKMCKMCKYQVHMWRGHKASCDFSTSRISPCHLLAFELPSRTSQPSSTCQTIGMCFQREASSHVVPAHDGTRAREANISRGYSEVSLVFWSAHLRFTFRNPIIPYPSISKIIQIFKAQGLWKLQPYKFRCYALCWPGISSTSLSRSWRICQNQLGALVPKCSANIAAVIQLKLCGDRGASNFWSKQNLLVWVYTSVFECCTSRPWCADAFHLNSWNLMNLCSHCTPLGAVLSQSLYGKAFSSQPARAFWSQKVSGTATRNWALMRLCLVPFCPSSFSSFFWATLWGFPCDWVERDFNDLQCGRVRLVCSSCVKASPERSRLTIVLDWDPGIAKWPPLLDLFLSSQRKAYVGILLSYIYTL